MELPNIECVRLFEEMTFVQLSATLQSGQNILSRKARELASGGESASTDGGESSTTDGGGERDPRPKKKKKKVEVDLETLNWFVTKPCKREGCGKCDKVYSGTELDNRSPFSESIQLQDEPHYSCLNDKNIVYGKWCWHPGGCLRENGQPSLIKIGQTGTPLHNDRIGQQLQQVKSCTTTKYMPNTEVANHFRHHWENDDEKRDPYQFVSFSILQQLGTDKDENDRLRIERALIIRFNTILPDYGINRNIPNPSTETETPPKQSTSSPLVNWAQNQYMRSAESEPKRPFPLKIAVALALKQTEVPFQALSSAISKFLFDTFTCFSVKPSTIRSILHCNGDQDYESFHVSQEDKTKWFYTAVKGRPGHKGSRAIPTQIGFRASIWPSTNRKLIEWLGDADNIAILYKHANPEVDLQAIIDLSLTA